MNDHAIDSMIYAWQVMKEQEENKMEGIFLGKIDLATFNPRSISLSFRTKHLDQHVEVRKELDYDCDYVLVKADDVITTNDEILKLRDEVKRLTDECADWKARYAKANNYITGVEKGCESLREDRDYWKDRFDSAVTDFTKTLAANGIRFTLKAIDGNGNWDIGFDIPGANELKDENERLKTKVDDLFNERGVLQAKLVKRGAELECVKSENSELKKDLHAANNQLDKMDADIDELKNKNRDLEKELAESKTFAEVEYKWNNDGSFTITYTKCDGTKEVIGMDLSGSVDATSISCGTVPKCSSCAHYKYHPSRSTHDWCYMPIPKEGGAGYIRKLSKEEAEGPACDKFEARKE